MTNIEPLSYLVAPPASNLAWPVVPQPIARTLRLDDMAALLGLPASEVRRRIATGRVPRPLPNRGRATFWLESQVREWIAAGMPRRRTEKQLAAARELRRLKAKARL
jgi:predicted DNA-binding transcriptional regulator AlpA